MTALCQPLPASVVQDFLQDAARMLCDRPGETAAQRDKRTHRMVYTVMGFQPRDGLEYMLSTMALGHYDLILDAMHDAFQGQIDTMKTKSKAGVVALGSGFRGLLTDLRRASARPLTEEAQRAQDARQAAEAARRAAAPTPEPAPESAQVAEEPAPAAPTPVAAPVAAQTPEPPTEAATAQPATPRPAASVPAGVPVRPRPAAAPPALSRAPSPAAQAYVLELAKTANGD